MDPLSLRHLTGEATEMAALRCVPPCRPTRATPTSSSLRLGVVGANTRALALWRGLGYRETGEVKSTSEFVAEVIVLEKPLRRAGDE